MHERPPEPRRVRGNEPKKLNLALLGWTATMGVLPRGHNFREAGVDMEDERERGR